MRTAIDARTLPAYTASLVILRRQTLPVFEFAFARRNSTVAKVASLPSGCAEDIKPLRYALAHMLVPGSSRAMTSLEASPCCFPQLSEQDAELARLIMLRIEPTGIPG